MAPELEEGIKEMMKQLVQGLVGKGKKFISEHFYHFRVKQMFQQSDNGEHRYKVEIGLNLFGDFDLELKDFDGNSTHGLDQMHTIYKLLDKVLVAGGARRLTGPPPRGPIERQLGKYLDKGWIGGSWKGDKADKSSQSDGKDNKKKAGKASGKGGNKKKK